jgi:23S rRNA pseudouridine2605 synthase
VQKKSTQTESNTYRLNKYLALAGAATSRRNADEIIKDRKIKIDGKIVDDFSFQVNPLFHKVFYLNKEVSIPTETYYVLFNKPKDCITTTNDEKKRKTIYDLINLPYKEQLKPVGRLDRNTTGLLLLTNDGEFINKLTHPSYQVVKIYQATLDKVITKLDLEKFQKGCKLEDGEFIPDEVVKIEGNNKIGIQIHSGKNRIVRRFFEFFGFKVIQLDRVFFAGLTKYQLPRGKTRIITPKELRYVNSQVKNNS